MKTTNQSYAPPPSRPQQTNAPKAFEVCSQSLDTLNIFGFNVSGVDPRLLTDMHVLLTVPMKAGKAKVMALDHDAKLKIHEDCSAMLSISLRRNENMALALEKFSLEFSRPVKIKNPSGSLEPSSGKNSALSVIKDKIADVKISSIEIDGQGQILLNGEVKLLHMLKKQLPKIAGQLEIPALDEKILAMLGLISSTDIKQETHSLAHLSDKININKIFENINATCERASYEIIINGNEARATFLKNNTLLQGAKAPLTMRLVGYADLSQAGDLQVRVEGEQSRISGSLGNFVPDLDAHISHRPGYGVRMHLVGELCGEAQGVSIDTFSNKEVKSVLPRRRQASLSPLSPQSEDDFNLSCGAKRVEVNSHININAEFNNGLQKISGLGRFDMRAHEPYAKTHERGIILGGRASAHLRVAKFSYEPAFGLTNTSAHAKFGLHPNERTRRHYPELGSVVYKYNAEINGPNEAEITPPIFGASRILRPVKNFEGHDERVDTNLTKTNFRTIGTKKYYQHVAKITGAKPRHADKVELLIDGFKSMPKRLELINKAQKLLCFQTLVFKSDESGWDYAHALVNAAKRGVRVVGVIDALGNIESLKELTKPNAIYSYLQENGVELKLYNGFLEEGLRKILSIAQRYPGVFNTYDKQSMWGIAEVLRFFEQVADVATTNLNALPKTVRHELQNSIHVLLNGQEGVSPHNSVHELKQILSGNMTTFDELLLAIKRIGDASYRWHEKYLMVDGIEAIVGGMNIADEYLQGGTSKIVSIKNKNQPAWRDSDVYLSGEIVKDVFNSFKQNWFHVAQEHIELKNMPKKDYNKQEGYTVSMIQHRPSPDGDHNVTNFLLYNLRTLKAGEKAWFETAYFLPRGVLRSLQKEMVAAAKRGVDLRILTNSETTSDFGPLVEAAVFDTRELLRAGARVFHRNQDRMVHAKVSVLGDKLTMIGSWNMDNRSASHDSEDVCAIYDLGITEQMSEQLIKDMFEQSDEISLASIDKRSLGKELRSAAMLLMGELA